MIAASERQGLSPRITAYINTLDQMLSIIAAGGGIGWVPRSYGRSPCKGVVARPVTDFRMTISLEMVWPEASKNPLVTGLADIVSSKVSKRVAV
jgi:DNA-binding transcriptional LysR family regulator